VQGWDAEIDTWGSAHAATVKDLADGVALLHAARTIDPRVAGWLDSRRHDDFDDAEEGAVEIINLRRLKAVLEAVGYFYQEHLHKVVRKVAQIICHYL
jgi:hypothetical protein